MSPSKRQDVTKQREAVQYVDDLITKCQTHVSLLSSVYKTGNYNLIPPWIGLNMNMLQMSKVLSDLDLLIVMTFKSHITSNNFKKIEIKRHDH